jgi:hypothetical protein
LFQVNSINRKIAIVPSNGRAVVFNTSPREHRRIKKRGQNVAPCVTVAVEKAKAEIISGAVTVHDYMSDNSRPD